MLTIFEYLRKRASESVLAGVHDAIEALNGKSAGAAGPASEPPAKGIEERMDKRAPPPPSFDPQNYLAGPGPLSDTGTENLPPPRRRGRPPNRETRNGSE